MGYAFISYCSANQTEADALRSLFHRNNVDTWMACYDVPPGKKYAAVITGAIRDCACVTLLLTEEAQASDAVDSEIELAKSKFKKPIVAIKRRDVELNDAFLYYVQNSHMCVADKIDGSLFEIKKMIESVKAFTGSGEPSASAAAVKIERDAKIYEGALDATLTGKGKITYENGNVYEGDIVDGKRHGKGELRRSDGIVFEGDFSEDQCTGKGKLMWPNGEVYEGDFIDGKRTGYGKYTWPDGGRYEGDFVEDKRTGKGKLVWANGDIYEGDFVDGNRTGKGKFVWTDGDIYEGEFVDGKLHNGVHLNSQGRKVATYRNGERTYKTVKPYDVYIAGMPESETDTFDMFMVDLVMPSLSWTRSKMDISRFGEDTEVTMATMIENSRCVVAFLTKASQESENLQNELEIAKACQKPLIPVLLDHTVMSRKMKQIFAGEKAIRLTFPYIDETQTQELLSRIKWYVR